MAQVEYKYIIIISAQTSWVYNIQEIVSFSAIALDAKTKLVLASYSRELAPHFVKPLSNDNMSFSFVYDGFRELFADYLSEALYVTVGNKLLHKIIPGQLLMDEKIFSKGTCRGQLMDNNGACRLGGGGELEVPIIKEWCNIARLFQICTGISVRTLSHNQQSRKMVEFYDIPWRFRIGLDWCYSIAAVIRKLCDGSNENFNLRPTCRAASGDGSVLEFLA